MRLKYFITAFLLLTVTAFVQNVSSEVASDNTTLELTSEETAFLKSLKQVRLGVDSSRPPFEFIDEKGVYSGITAGFIEYCTKRLGINIVLVKGLNVGAAMKKLQDGEIDVIPKISLTRSVPKVFYLQSRMPRLPQLLLPVKMSDT